MHKTHLLPLSARNEAALKVSVQNLLMGMTSGMALEDLCYTTSLQRDHRDYRLALVFDSREELIENLEAYLRGIARPRIFFHQKIYNRRPKLAFVFCGQGPSWLGMGQQLMEQEPAFRSVIDDCDSILRSFAHWSLLEELRAEESNSKLDETQFGQPAIVALQAGVAALWRSWGVEPDALVGHSIGETTAAYVGGSLSLKDALRVAYYRGRISERAAGGGKMAAVGLSLEEARAAVKDYGGRLVVAAVNGPKSTVLSGETDALAEVLRKLEAKNLFFLTLRPNYAFHTRQMEPLVDDLTEELKDIGSLPSVIPIFSTDAGDRFGMQEEDFCGAYWARKICKPVLFQPAVEKMIDDGFDIFLEIGPHPVLTADIRQCLENKNKEGFAFHSLRHGGPERKTMLSALAALYTLGQPIEWKTICPSGRNIPIPGFP